jgi:hypothetical protein
MTTYWLRTTDGDAPAIALSPVISGSAMTAKEPPDRLPTSETDVQGSARASGRASCHASRQRRSMCGVRDSRQVLVLRLGRWVPSEGRVEVELDPDMEPSPPVELLARSCGVLLELDGATGTGLRGEGLASLDAEAAQLGAGPEPPV